MFNLGNELERIVNESKASVSGYRKQVMKEIEWNFGGLVTFKSRLRESVISTPDDPNFNKVYDLYSRSFGPEREEEAWLKQALAQNSEPKFEGLYGPIKEQWMTLLHPFKDEVIGASCALMNLFDDIESRSVGTLHEVYSMVAPEYMGLGFDSLIFEKNIEHLIKFWLDSKRQALMGDTYVHLFNEQKKPIGYNCR